MNHSLPGGHVNEVLRVGDTVRRLPGDRAEFVHRLLEHFDRSRWRGAPRFIGVDDMGREVLSFIEGHVAWAPEQPSDIWSDESLSGVARLVRGFHDLTQGTPLAGDSEVVCHNDLSPKNTVYRDDGSGMRPVAFIDWDIAGPGDRIHDVAHVCWQFAGLRPENPNPSDAGRKVRLLCDAYGVLDRSEVLSTVLWWQDRCWRGIEAQADAGVPAMIRLRNSGASRQVRAAYDWVLTNREVLEVSL